MTPLNTFPTNAVYEIKIMYKYLTCIVHSNYIHIAVVEQHARLIDNMSDKLRNL